MRPWIKLVQVAGSAFVCAALFIFLSSCTPGRPTADQSAASEAPANGTPARIRLITEAQFRNTIQGIFGSDIVMNIAFPIPARVQGLVSLGYSSVGLTPGQIEGF